MISTVLAQVFFNNSWHITISLLVVYWLLWLWQRRHLYKFAWSFPGFWGWPILGEGLNVVNWSNFLPFVGEGFARSKQNTYDTWLNTNYTIITQDPEFTRHILTSPNFVNSGDALVEPIIDFAGEGILAVSSPKWETLKKMISPCFNYKLIYQLFPTFNAKARIAVMRLGQLNEQRAHKLSTLLHDITAESAMATILGVATSKPFGNEDKAYSDALAGFIKLMPVFLQMSSTKVFWLAKYFFKEYQSWRRYMRDFMDEHLARSFEMKEQGFQQDCQNKNVDDEIMLKDKYIYVDLAFQLYKNKQLSWDEIISVSNNMMAAGIETTSLAIYTTIMLLAMHAEVQQKLYDEITAFYKDDVIDVTYEDFAALPYLDMVINESLRLFPPLPIFTRKCSKPTQLSESLTLPKDVQVIISVHHIHRNKDFWGPNADKFDPNQFLPELMSQRHAYAFIPFAKGMRSCLGWRYTMFMIKIFIIKLVQKYSFTTTFKLEDLRIAPHAVLCYIEEPEIKVHHRTPAKDYIIND